MMTHLEIEEEPMNPDDVEYYFEQVRVFLSVLN